MLRSAGLLAQAVGAPAFTSKDALGMLLSTESLLFAALNVAVGLSAMSPQGSGPGIPRTLSTGAAAVLTVAAVGAGLAWVDLFPDGQVPTGTSATAVWCIAVGIAAQPIIAWTLVILVWMRT